MDSITEKLKKYASPTQSKWREQAEFRRENKSWLMYSLSIALATIKRMDELGMSQATLAERMGCSQQYVSKILKGRENLSLGTISKLETSLDFSILSKLK